MHLFFSTPIWTSKIDDYDKVNEEMLNFIINLQKKDSTGIVKSNFKGWHSKDFDLKNEEPKNFIEGIKKGNTRTINVFHRCCCILGEIQEWLTFSSVFSPEIISNINPTKLAMHFSYNFLCSCSLLEIP